MSDCLSHSCPTCGGTGKSRCRLCKEIHRGVPPYIGCTGGECPNCVEGYPKDRIERATRLAIDAVAAEIGFMPTEEALKALWLGVPVAIRAFHNEGTE